MTDELTKLRDELQLKYMKPEHREIGTISAATYHLRDGCRDTYEVCVMLDFGGHHQGFQALLQEAHASHYVMQLCALFGVCSYTELVGKRCYALRSFSHNNARIHGLETLAGLRFLRHVWARQRGLFSGSVLQHELKQSRDELSNLEQRRRKLERQVNALIEDFVDWETAR